MLNLFEQPSLQYPVTIGEISANHEGSIERVLTMIDLAATAGFSSIKFQTYTADDMTRPGLHKITKGLWKGYDLYELYKQGAMPREWHKDLFDYAREKNILPFTTVFHTNTIEFVEQFEPAAYKIASFEITYHDLIRAAAETGRPLVLSTGMATEREILDSLEIAHKYGNGRVFALKCTSAYPAEFSQLNLETIRDLKRTVDIWYPGTKIGFSDHTIGCLGSALAAALGAQCIEKHITLFSTDTGLDSKFSLPASEYLNFTRSIKNAVDSLGSVHYGPTLDERDSLIYRRSIHKIGDEELILRPSNGKPL